jgi:hypothetical protein
MKSILVRLVGNCLALAALCLALEAPAAGDLQSALAAVRVPGSDLELVSNAAQSQNAPFSKQMKELQKELEQEMTDEDMLMGKKVEELLKSIGITDESLNYLVASLSIRSINTEGETPKVPALAAFAVKEPLEAAKIVENVTRFANDEGAQIQLAESAYKDVPMITVTFDPNNLPEDVTPEAAAFLSGLVLALPANGTVVFFGQDEQVKAGIDRMLGGTAVPRSEGLTIAKALVPAEADSYLIFDMPDAFRQFMALQAQNAADNPMMAGPMTALAGLKGASFSCVTTEKASLALGGDFETPENAMQIKVALDMMMGMIKMQLMNMAAGTPMPFLDTMKTANEGTKASLSFDVTIQDMRSFLAFAQRMQQQQQGAPAPGAAPAPAGIPAP